MTSVTQRESSDRPIASALKPLRAATRRVRLLRLQVMSGGRLSVGDNFAISCNAKILCPNHFRAGDDVRSAWTSWRGGRDDRLGGAGVGPGGFHR
jgi:hypothetical protein